MTDTHNERIEELEAKLARERELLSEALTSLIKMTDLEYQRVYWKSSKDLDAAQAQGYALVEKLRARETKPFDKDEDTEVHWRRVVKAEALENANERLRELLEEAIGYLRIGAFRPLVGAMINNLIEKIGKYYNQEIENNDKNNAGDTRAGPG